MEGFVQTKVLSWNLWSADTSFRAERLVVFYAKITSASHKAESYLQHMFGAHPFCVWGDPPHRMAADAIWQPLTVRGWANCYSPARESDSVKGTSGGLAMTWLPWLRSQAPGDARRTRMDAMPENEFIHHYFPAQRLTLCIVMAYCPNLWSD